MEHLWRVQKRYYFGVKFNHHELILFQLVRAWLRPPTASRLGVCEWSPEGLHDKSVSLIPNTDDILKLVKKKLN